MIWLVALGSFQFHANCFAFRSGPFLSVSVSSIWVRIGFARFGSGIFLSWSVRLGNVTFDICYVKFIIKHENTFFFFFFFCVFVLLQLGALVGRRSLGPADVAARMVYVLLKGKRGFVEKAFKVCHTCLLYVVVI